MFVAARCLSCFNKKERSRVLTVRGFIFCPVQKILFSSRNLEIYFFSEKKFSSVKYKKNV
jgi:hypothetical protein